MKIHDISMTINKQMSVYKGLEEKRPEFIKVKNLPLDSVNETEIKMNLHTGTHIDAPKHIFENGETIEKTDLHKLISKCIVLDLTDVSEGITDDDLRTKDIQNGDAVLLKTSNSKHDPIPVDFVYLTETGAKYLVDRNVTVVGIDSLGIERNQKGHPTHKTLMNAGVIIIEGLSLGDIKEGEYLMMALPLKIEGADGAPARIILSDLSD